jgi:Phosphotransferase enzyme family
VQRSPLSLSMRVQWADLPEDVRAEIERACGGRVKHVTPIVEGFSPGFVACIELVDGDRIFAKLADNSLNERPGRLHLQEAKVLERISGRTRAPRLVGKVQTAQWSGLLTEFVDGRVADRADDLFAALNLADAISNVTPPTSLETLASLLEHDFLWFGLRKLAQRDGHLPHNWDANQASVLLNYERHLLAALAGDSLVHGDMRADNVILASDGSGAVAVDWPSGAIGNACFDTVVMCASLALESNANPGELFAQSSRCRYADPQIISTLIIGLYGHYAWASSLGDPPGIPGVRAYQQAMAHTCGAWALDRICRIR